MTTGMPELGSKISLISKADIRYEGRLFTVDPQECTIALASVRSFGTEDRDTQFPVPAQNQVYDYILFRGSDIKDIRVVTSVSHPQPLNDPAIMQLSVPPTLGAQQYQQHPILGHMGHNPYGSFLPMGGLTSTAAPGLPAGINRGGSAAGGSKPSELIISPPGGSSDVGVAAPIMSPTPVGEPPRPSDHSGSVLDFIGGGAASRSTTPASVGSRKSLSVDQGTQAGGSQQRDGSKRQVKPIQPPRGQQQQRNKSRERRDSQNRNVENQEHGGHYYQNQGRPQSRGRPQQHQNNQGGYQYNRGGWVNHQRGMPRGRGRAKGGPFRPGGPPGQAGAKKNTLKFDSEYDFEQANTEFEELRSKLAKVKLDEASGSKPEVNGAPPVEVEKKDDSGNETGAGETEQDEDHEVFYDKSKSFFDKISCEAVERAKGKMQRTDWRQERKLNSETFGVAATRRGSYRGRGGFRGGYRGGYRGSYRYPQQRRTNDQQQNNQQNQQEEKESMPVYSPLTGEEAVAKKQEESKKLQDSEKGTESDVQIEKLVLGDKTNGEIKEDLALNKHNSVQESTESLDAKKHQDNEKVVAADPPACVGQ